MSSRGVTVPRRREGCRRSPCPGSRGVTAPVRPACDGGRAPGADRGLGDACRTHRRTPNGGEHGGPLTDGSVMPKTSTRQPLAGNGWPRSKTSCQQHLPSSVPRQAARHEAPTAPDVGWPHTGDTHTSRICSTQKMTPFPART